MRSPCGIIFHLWWCVCIYICICTGLDFNQSNDNYVLKEAFLNGQAAMKKNVFIHLCNVVSVHENQRLHSCLGRMWDAFPLVHFPWLRYSKRSYSSSALVVILPTSFIEPLLQTPTPQKYPACIRILYASMEESLRATATPTAVFRESEEHNQLKCFFEDRPSFSCGLI